MNKMARIGARSPPAAFGAVYPALALHRAACGSPAPAAGDPPQVGCAPPTEIAGRLAIPVEPSTIRAKNFRVSFLGRRLCGNGGVCDTSYFLRQY